MNIDFFSAFIIGLLGSGHCIGMCGGITSMLTSAMPQNKRKPSAILVFSYNIGRILSYTLIGAIAGFTGSLAIHSLGFPLTILRVLAALFLILLGLYMGQWAMILSKLETLGKHLWKHISPLSRKLIPVTTPSKALLLGTLWGWLPCGLVYSTLTWSLASGNALNGASIMFAFGLGTLPALVTLSFGFFSIGKLVKDIRFRQFIGLSLICYGIYSLQVAYSAWF
ncbi:sulfite exporter TauE/SafE family protein [Thalassotalea atypica]|uniref:sulfite exporter TauE/SafE family protein n=1 Tax=Thalassotalea atypica TaxID=2054316 RepID=UPI0025747F5D|nr:sulfite exporter TauE/SafE family protein [Thalassotalea atypica]